MSIKKNLLNLCVVFFTCASLQGEIQQVRLQWTPGQCELGCINLLTNALEQIPGVASVKTSPDLGEAELRWKPNMTFSYKDIDYTFRRIGLANRNTYVAVLGTITNNQSSITLVSIGDFTNFILLGSILPSTTEEVTRHNPLSFPLSPKQQSDFLEIEHNSQTVLVKGRLLDPYRYFFSQYLIIDSYETPKQ